MSSSKDNLNEFFSSTSGKAGSALLLIFLIISTFVVFTYPLDFGTTVWNNPAYWSDYPKSAPPSWTALFNDDEFEHQIIEFTSPSDVVKIPNQEERIYTQKLILDKNSFPTFISLSMNDILAG